MPSEPPCSRIWPSCRESSARYRQDGSGGTSVVYLNVNGGLVEMLVDTKHVGFYTDDQLKQIAITLHLASIGDPSTWFDATTAMPR
jgi:hypothetical protein